jgi:hypothetical protein
MPRLTLDAGNALGQVMGKLQADQVFQGHDDLVFDLPGDRTLGPVQNFSTSSTAVPLRRNTNGYTSWMATIVPRLDRTGVWTDEYTLSIVVFDRRIIDPATNDENRASERVVLVSSFYSGAPAVGGGDVQLAARRNAKEDLELRSGQWVMLSSTKLTPTGTIQVHQWYRIVNAGEGPTLDTTNNVWVRDVTLIGPDWDWGHMGANTPVQYNTPTQVTIVRGTVAVFEKTIRLETTSLWTN